MPTALRQLPRTGSAVQAPPRKKWTRAEIDALEATGVFSPEHLELVDGDILSQVGKKRRHANCQTLMLAWLAGTFGARCVNVEAPIDVAPEDNPTNEPVPDRIVLRRDLSHFPKLNPKPQDLHLVVEISDTTLQYDLGVKAALYARAGIAEYWVLDAEGHRLIVHRGPRDGAYREVEVYSADESVSPLATPLSALRISEVFVD